MKIFINVLLVFSFFALSAQTEQNFILNTNIGYNYAYEDKAEDLTYGIPSPLSDKKINNLKLSFAIGKQFNKNFYYGLGIALNLQKVEWNPGVNKPLVDSGLGISFNSSNAVSKNNAFGPLAYIQYNLNLSERSRFLIMLISQYDFENTIHEYNTFVPGILFDEDYFTTYNTKYESNRQYFNIGLVPGYRMNLYKNFGVDITMGSLAYRIKTVESRLPDTKKSREFNIGFKPENWTIGFHLIL